MEPDEYDGEPFVDEQEEEEGEELLTMDELLAEATAATEEEQKLKRARKRLAQIANSLHPAADSEQAELLAIIKDLEERRVWHTIGRVALFRSQECQTCGSRHSYFEGWFWEQAHVSDKNSRRLSRHSQAPGEPMPERREDHFTGQVELCSDCVECVLAINVATTRGATSAS